MKKKYIEPAIKVCIVKAHTMFASSPTEPNGPMDEVTAAEQLGKEDNDFGW